MHDDIMLDGVFRICLWLVATATADTKTIERFMNKAKSQFVCDPRVIRALRATKL